MKKTNVYFFHSVSWSLKSLVTGVFLLVFIGLAHQGSAQIQAPTPESVLPPLKSKTECVEIAKTESALLSDQIKLDPNNQALRGLWDAYTFIIINAAEPFFDMPLILAQLYGVMHTTPDGTTTHSYGFYAKSWNRSYTDIVNKFKN